MERRIIVIVGPTCSGKTALGILLAEKLKTEIISADSRQIYKYLNIGTAKPSDKELKKVKHHFINLLEPNEDYNVSKFENEAAEICNKLLSNNKIPIVVGGSGLYIKALIDGIIDIVETDNDYRKQLINLKEKYGNEFLHNELKKVDEISAENIHPNYWKRVMRALEVYHLTGKPIWQHYKEQKRDISFNFVQHGLMPDRKALYENIDARVEKMINKGLEDEVKKILYLGYDKKLNSLNTVGYKEIISYLESEISFERAVELIKRNTRRYAKRQITWFSADDRITWHKIESQKDLNIVADEIIRGEELNVKIDRSAKRKN